MPPGYVDLHSHILPGVDDGCTVVEESLECVQQLIDVGFAGTVCTPHVCVAECPDNTPHNIRLWVDALQAEIDAAGLAYRLWPGAEVRLAPETVDWFGEHGVPTLGPSREVLVDYWGRGWPDFCQNAIDDLLANGYQPILGHPERMVLPDEELRALLDRLLERGVKLQGNLRCLTNTEDGSSACERMRQLLREERYYVVATDVHGPADLACRLAGLDLLLEHAGTELATTLLERRPWAIVDAGQRELVTE